ncbi:uncharacterized protein CLUP02_00606 [Colletotrichum lupini]|uniref:Uncharacterized protein n=1 Tax=Colletotrichum lupini TaxID=145971 RepID=A0A9Q8W8C4_9PEZI|nr:uncharacterized protein CLUP02_00606 [Colletotrichum lupini]UQC73959.1 hypothetical protein CLUP02_00606 [Colletotrichum lupini]
MDKITQAIWIPKGRENASPAINSILWVPLARKSAGLISNPAFQRNALNIQPASFRSGWRGHRWEPHRVSKSRSTIPSGTTSPLELTTKKSAITCSASCMKNQKWFTLLGARRACHLFMIGVERIVYANMAASGDSYATAASNSRQARCGWMLLPQQDSSLSESANPVGRGAPNYPALLVLSIASHAERLVNSQTAPFGRALEYLQSPRHTLFPFGLCLRFLGVVNLCTSPMSLARSLLNQIYGIEIGLGKNNAIDR